MAVMESCCLCGYSVRTGSFISACYTILFFLVFIFVTGNMTYLEISGWVCLQGFRNCSSSSSEAEVGGASGGRGGGANQTLMAGNGTMAAGGNVEDESEFALSQSLPFSLYLLVVDFICEVCGFVSSFVLLQGLRQDRKGLLIPWMIFVPFHTLIDMYSAVDILISSAALWIRQHQLKDYAIWQLIFGTGFGTLTSAVNIYVFLCVYSQYQEYCAGRGTAAHEAIILNEQNFLKKAAVRDRREGEESDLWNYDEDEPGNVSKSKQKKKKRSGNVIPLMEVSAKMTARSTESLNTSGFSTVDSRRNCGVANQSVGNKSVCGNHLAVPVATGKMKHPSAQVIQDDFVTGETVDEC